MSHRMNLCLMCSTLLYMCKGTNLRTPAVEPSFALMLVGYLNMCYGVYYILLLPLHISHSQATYHHINSSGMLNMTDTFNRTNCYTIKRSLHGGEYCSLCRPSCLISTVHTIFIQCCINNVSIFSVKILQALFCNKVTKR